MYTMSPAFKHEKHIITECMKLYKEFPCLWDNRQVIYANKEAREHAYEVMLEKYRQLHVNATVNDLKKRIENMRSSYRREHKKVLVAKQKGDVHVPQLWYYDLMTFLNVVMDFCVSEENCSEDIDFIDSPSRRKRRPSPNLSNLYLDDSDDGLGRVGSDLMQLNQQCDTVAQPAPTSTFQPNSETEAFGTTLGLQLKELDNMQKIFAEKLISDVIYNARLQRLTFNSNLIL